ncbi:MAG TPA: putative sulfate exporter family transporter [Actinomycetaceae bacterium]|nr:putative sulfate exporter family transporter [Actinomycetaceae bacterium]
MSTQDSFVKEPGLTSADATPVGGNAPTPEVAATLAQSAPSAASHRVWTAVGLVVVFLLTALVQWLTDWVPEATAGTGFGQIAKSIEFPIYAILLGFGANALLSILGVRERMSAAFRTEFFIKTGLVLLGASINFGVIASAAGPAIVQAVLLITTVFLFTWWFAGVLGLDHQLRALLASAISICGVSAAVAAAGTVQAKKEQLAYTATLVVMFAVPMIFLLPWLANLLGLSEAVTGAWIGGNIDTTAAVTAAGAVAGERPLQIATIVKVTQNALLGVVAVLLSAWYAFKAQKDTDGTRPRASMLWKSFPKFVLGFLVASVIATIFVSTADPEIAKSAIGTANALRGWFLTAAFISIGLEFSIGSLKDAGAKPILVFAVATLVNLVVGLGLAVLFWSGFTF